MPPVLCRMDNASNSEPAIPTGYSIESVELLPDWCNLRSAVILSRRCTSGSEESFNVYSIGSFGRIAYEGSRMLHQCVLLRRK